ncbi:MAG: ABC transporter permease [Elusimicrobia bacterium]|nr:ABC transporter permease [Elusimicrobiota bacterium]
MIAYLYRRILMFIPIIFGITIITFFIMHLSPGKPTDTTEFQSKVSSEIRQKFIAIYGLDKPWYVQYVNWLKRLSRLDFGRSFKDDAPVLQKIAGRLPATLLLNLCSLFLIFIVAVPMGVLSALKKDSVFDRISGVVVFAGFSVPTFWLALILMIVFGIKLRLLPISGIRSVSIDEISGIAAILDTAKHLVLPVFVSAFTGLAGMSRYVRQNMLEVIRQDYIRTARAKGLKEKDVVIKHALRNALLPIVTVMGLSIPGLIGGGFIFETIFAWPGMGRLGYEAIMSRDYPVIMGVSTIAAFLTLAGNFIADITYAYLDPRIRHR